MNPPEARQTSYNNKNGTRRSRRAQRRREQRQLRAQASSQIERAETSRQSPEACHVYDARASDRRRPVEDLGKEDPQLQGGRGPLQVGTAGGRRWPASWPGLRSARDRMRSLLGHPLRAVDPQARLRTARVPDSLPGRVAGAVARQKAAAGRHAR